MSFFTGKLKFTDSRVIFETMKTKEGKHFLCPPEGRRGQQNRDNDFYIVTCYSMNIFCNIIHDISIWHRTSFSPAEINRIRSHYRNNYY